MQRQDHPCARALRRTACIAVSGSSPACNADGLHGRRHPRKSCNWRTTSRSTTSSSERRSWCVPWRSLSSWGRARSGRHGRTSAASAWYAVGRRTVPEENRQVFSGFVPPRAGPRLALGLRALASRASRVEAVLQLSHSHDPCTKHPAATPPHAN